MVSGTTKGRFALVALVGGVFACSEHQAQSDSQQVAAPVVGGVPSGPERDAVVLLYGYGPDRSTLCTATLVAPNLIATARHCVSVYTEGTFSCTLQGNIDVDRERSPYNAGGMGPLFPASSIFVHTGQSPDHQNAATVGKQVLALETDTICRNDIAFVVLEDELDLPVAPVRLQRGTFRGENTLVVGYGMNESRTTTRHERAGVEVLAIGPSEFYPVTGNARPRTIVVGPSACSGDSGGPALAEDTLALLGVSSLSRGACESSEVRNHFTQLAPFGELALRAFEAAGHEPVYEPGQDDEPSVGGSAGSDAGWGGASGAAGGPPDNEEPKEPSLSTPGKSAGGCTWFASRAASESLVGLFSLLLFAFAGVFRHRVRVRSCVERGTPAHM